MKLIEKFRNIPKAPTDTDEFKRYFDTFGSSFEERGRNFFTYLFSDEHIEKIKTQILVKALENTSNEKIDRIFQAVEEVDKDSTKEIIVW